MGCVQAKTKSPTHGSQVLDKLKVDHGYVKGGGEGRPIGLKAPGKEPVKLVKVNAEVKADSGGGGKGGDRVVSRKTEKGNVSGRLTVKQTGGDDDDIVDGLPKWLVENVPPEVLDGLVPKSADSYDKLAKIGQGTYSNVYKARDRDTKKIVALKKVRFDTSEPESIKFLAREITILRKLDHPNVIKLEGLATSRMQYSLYLVFEFMQHDLTRIISRPEERLTEPQVKCYMQQLLSGLQHCHEKGILHRDIKPSNLLIDKNGTLKIADFGLANFFPPKQKRPLTSRVVTLWYRAPELLLGSTVYGVGIDLWSVGCLLGEMFVGRTIIPGRTEVEQLHKIFKLCGSPLDDYWKKMKLPTSFRPPHHYKPSFEEFFRDFSTPAFGLLTTLLALDSTSRGSAASGLQSEASTKKFFSSSPLACNLPALPVLYKEEDNLAETKDQKKKLKNFHSNTFDQMLSKPQRIQLNSNTDKCTLPVQWRSKHPKYELPNCGFPSGIRRVYKVRQWSQTNRDFHQRKVEGRGEFGSSTEEKNAETGTTHSQDMGSMHSQEMGNTSASSNTSSTFRPFIHENLNASLSPIIRSHRKRFPSTEGHPNALKNINPDVLKNFTLLQASIKDIGYPTESGTYRRSHSTLDFRNFDPEKIFGFDKV